MDRITNPANWLHICTSSAIFSQHFTCRKRFIFSSQKGDNRMENLTDRNLLNEYHLSQQRLFHSPPFSPERSSFVLTHLFEPWLKNRTILNVWKIPWKRYKRAHRKVRIITRKVLFGSSAVLESVVWEAAMLGLIWHIHPNTLIMGDFSTHEYGTV